MRRIFLPLFGLIAAGGFAGCGPKDAAAPAAKPAPAAALPELRVAAAADLAKAFAEVGAAFENKTGQKTVFTFGASGTLTRQIEADAPFDVFAAANQDYIDKLAKEGKITPESKAVYAIGQVVLWTRKSEIPPPKSLQDLTAARFAHIALANPEHAPYGKAAQEALQNLKLGNALRAKIVYGENVQQAFQFAQSGNADAALISHALTYGVEGDTLLVPQELYTPLRQSTGIVKASKQAGAAKDFIAFVTGPQGREILQKYGFSLP